MRHVHIYPYKEVWTRHDNDLLVNWTGKSRWALYTVIKHIGRYSIVHLPSYTCEEWLVSNGYKLKE